MSDFHICEEGKQPRIHPARYAQLVQGQDELAQYEVRQGWHFCPDHSDMLIVRNSTKLCQCPTRQEVNDWLDEQVMPLVGQP